MNKKAKDSAGAANDNPVKSLVSVFDPDAAKKITPAKNLTDKKAEKSKKSKDDRIIISVPQADDVKIFNPVDGTVTDVTMKKNQREINQLLTKAKLYYGAPGVDKTNPKYYRVDPLAIKAKHKEHLKTKLEAKTLILISLAIVAVVIFLAWGVYGMINL